MWGDAASQFVSSQHNSGLYNVPQFQASLSLSIVSLEFVNFLNFLQVSHHWGPQVVKWLELMP